MAYVTVNRRGGFEVRESRATPNGPRSRTLATFRRLDDAVVARARERERAEKPPSAEELREAALRAGAPVAAAAVDRAAAETVRRLAAGERVDPMLRRLLLDALGREAAPASPRVSDAARAASEWIGVDPRRRGEALLDALEPALSEKVLALHQALARARLPHAFAGAIALAYYGEPRATEEIELEIFAEPDRWPLARVALAPLGVGVAADVAALERSGQARLRWSRDPLALTFAADHFHQEMRRAARRAPFAGGTIPILAPEQLAACKAIFDRPEDWIEIEQMIVATDPLDLPEVEAWLEELAGEDDQRLRRLRDLIGRWTT
jgi:hypothetical protein